MLRRTLYLLNSKKIGNDIISQYGQYMLIPPDKNSNWPSNLPVKAIIIGSNELYKNNTATHNSIISAYINLRYGPIILLKIFFESLS